MFGGIVLKQILEDDIGKKTLLMGNVAIVRGAIEAGVSFASTYPGTPASEIGDTFATLVSRFGWSGYFEYSTNEAVALEAAAGASFAGVRAICSMKHVGANVAADPLFSLAYTGVDGGLVVVTADDPSCWSSQNEQDNRHYAVHAGLPMLEPTSSQEALEMARVAFEISDKTSIHSEGVLGFIELDEQFARKVLTKTKDIADELLQKISRRCMVFPTGEEVRKDVIKDTNSPYIKERLVSEGYKVTIGPALPDDEYQIAAAIMNSIDEGYGLIITTGGVGAEAKDRTIEALRRIDPKAATAYIMKFHQGTGRHAKTGVMIGVGTFAPSIIVSLPGPNDEVKLSLEKLIEELNMEFDKYELADKIARTIKKKYIPKC